MKRLIPFIIAVILIVLIGAGYAGSIVMERYSYSQEKADLQSYFHLDSQEQVAVVWQDEIIEAKGFLSGGVCYFDRKTASELFTNRFYEDTSTGELLYVLPEKIESTVIGSSVVMIGDDAKDYGHPVSFYQGDELYLSVDLLKDHACFSYELYLDPNRILITSVWEPKQVAPLKKDTQIRYQGGVKSEILKEVSKGEQVTVLEAMDEWTKVKSSDGFIGYVENKKLGDPITADPIPDTDYTEPDYYGNPKEGKINMAWHQIGGVGGNDTFSGYTANVKGVNVISPTWFHLSDNSGKLESYASSSYVENAHAKGMEVWAAFNNFDDPGVDTYAVLHEQANRRFLISQIMEMAETYGLDGINIDFEGLSAETGPAFVEFIRELSIPCRMNGLVLSIDNYVPMSGLNAFYDLKEQGVMADYVVIMGYDEHYAGSTEAGSVASIGYVEGGIARTVELVPAEKVVNGIPFYTRIWETTGTEVSSQAVGMEVAQQWLRDHNISTKWLEEECQNYGEYMSGDTLYQCWLEDAESIQVKLNVMKNYEIAGVAEWRLDLETPEIWDVIAAYTASY